MFLCAVLTGGPEVRIITFSLGNNSMIHILFLRSKDLPRPIKIHLHRLTLVNSRIQSSRIECTRALTEVLAA